MIVRHTAWPCAMLAGLWLAGCAAEGPGSAAAPPRPAPAQAPRVQQPAKPTAASAAPPAAAARQSPAPAKPAGPPPIDPKVVSEAQAHLGRGLKAFQRGEYDEAEQQLKAAMTLYPFFAQANLALGKIFLIRGAAGKDYGLISSARLMFEMARALDPAMREPEILLDLFRSSMAE